jgi:predicted phage terminase large subunit-like protein
MSTLGAIIIIMTRWHEDDLVGRLTDPTNPCFNAEEAATWKIINIPAIAEEDDVLGRKIGEPLWPERFGLEYLLAFKRRNPVGFSALYQQHPTPAEGDFFKKEYLPTYRPEQLPKKLRVYGASDHAVGTKQTNDRNCLLIVGVDEDDVIWLLDCWWKRAKADETVEAMIGLMKRWKPVVWWAEGGHISKSIGPFLRRRMREEKVYINVREQTPSADKQQRAQAINGRCAMGMVRFPAAAHWTRDAIDECLKFPGGRNDDFVDTLAHIGLGLNKLQKAPIPRKNPRTPRAPAPSAG